MLASYTSDQTLLIGGLVGLGVLLFLVVALRQAFRVDQVVKHLAQSTAELAQIRSLLENRHHQAEGSPIAKAN